MIAPKTIQVSCVQMHWGRSLEWNLERTLWHIGLAKREGSRVVLFPEANLTSYYFPYAATLSSTAVRRSLDRTCEAVRTAGIWAIVGTLRKTKNRLLNLAHVIAPSGA